MGIGFPLGPVRSLRLTFVTARRSSIAGFKACCWGEEKEREKAKEEAFEKLQFLENELKEKRFFGGENIGLVDITGNIIGYWIGVFEEASGVKLLTREKFPKLCNWADEFVRVSAIKENLPPRDKLIATLRRRLGGANASK
ncbi:glutathione s-transferase u8 [Quercus suber]|uniref:Glutathione s-transferase u8 n=1 Tax=Quercus suber TaxID=58331 RepID=A0AAW0II97_QUESU